MVSGLLDTYSDDFIPIFYQFSNAAQQSWCWTRFNGFYGQSGVPNMWWDGFDNAGSGYSGYEADLLGRQGVPTDVTIEINVFRGGANLDVRANVCIEEGGEGKSLRLYFIQVLDHYLASPTYHRNAFRQVKTEDVTIAAGACVKVEQTMVLKDVDLQQLEDIGAVVFAQEPLDSGPADIFQAAFVFDPPGIKADGFEEGDLSGWE